MRIYLRCLRSLIPKIHALTSPRNIVEFFISCHHRIVHVQTLAKLSSIQVGSVITRRYTSVFLKNADLQDINFFLYLLFALQFNSRKLFSESSRDHILCRHIAIMSFIFKNVFGHPCFILFSHMFRPLQLPL
jgi:hypothetical protein